MKHSFDLANKIGWMQVILIALKVADISVLTWKQTLVPILFLAIIFIGTAIYIQANIDKVNKLLAKEKKDEENRLNQLNEIFKNDEM